MNGGFSIGVVADGDDEVGLLDRLVDVVALRQRRGAHVELGAAGHGALAHLGGEEGNARAQHELRTASDSSAAALPAAPSMISGRLRLHDHGGGAIERVAGWRSAARADAAASARRLGRLGGDVLRQFEMHRPGPLLLATRKASRTMRRDRGGRDDLARRFGQRPHRGDDVDDLEARLA